MEVSAYLKNARVSPKKMRLVADAVRGLAVVEALRRLALMRVKSAGIVAKTLKSAIANANHNHELDIKDLFVKKIIVNEGLDYKRFKPAAMGAAHQFKKRGSHLSVTVAVKEGVITKQSVKKETAEKVAQPSVSETAKPKKSVKSAATASTKPVAAKKK